MSKRCHNCGGPFGLIRHRNGTRQFCSRRCLATYYARLTQLVRQARDRTDATQHSNGPALAAVRIGARRKG